jgi:hypothetical protein
MEKTYLPNKEILGYFFHEMDSIDYRTYPDAEKGTWIYYSDERTMFLQPDQNGGFKITEVTTENQIRTVWTLHQQV